MVRSIARTVGFSGGSCRVGAGGKEENKASESVRAVGETPSDVGPRIAENAYSVTRSVKLDGGSAKAPTARAAATARSSAASDTSSKRAVVWWPVNWFA